VLLLLTLIAAVLVAGVVLWWQAREPESSLYVPAPCPPGEVCM
jgi:hypothetical protein